MTSMFLKEALLLLAGLAAGSTVAAGLRLSGGHRRLSAPDWKDGDGVEGENLLV
jgi:hypothetical protein